MQRPAKQVGLEQKETIMSTETTAVRVPRISPGLRWGLVAWIVVAVVAAAIALNLPGDSTPRGESNPIESVRHDFALRHAPAQASLGYSADYALRHSD